MAQNNKLVDKTRDYRKAIGEGADESLLMFEVAMGDFQAAFCDEMVGGSDFTIKLEVHGGKRKAVHYRVLRDSFRRPAGSSSKE